ncbi:hypothetical protein AB4K20DRAFT_1973681 [Rhizopus microsporus]|uniref:Uncharacterized protein n=1 Tax=Rhizopus microsporus TaxID=58291 RepID=A0A1X0RW48_RHIZD|nr:hypothetical protein BCV71DRAFT_256914 [Rhizopus microsporus]
MGKKMKLSNTCNKTGKITRSQLIFFRLSTYLSYCNYRGSEDAFNQAFLIQDRWLDQAFRLEKDTELLLLEISDYASIGQFKKVKVFFLNAAGKIYTASENKGRRLCLWSLCWQEDGLFDFRRECPLLIKPEFEGKQKYVPDLVKFCLDTKIRLLGKYVQDIATVQKEHFKNEAKYWHSHESPALLSDMVNPVSLKLTKEQDSPEIAELGSHTHLLIPDCFLFFIFK